MTQVLQELGDYVASTLSQDVEKVEVVLGELILTVKRDSIVRVLTFLRDDASCLFKQLMDVCGVDYPSRPERFDVVYNLLGLKHNHRIRVKLHTDEQAQVPSVIGVFKSAGWFEREVWDMYGVYFSEHPDLRRILTDYGFEGHPLRKDFPLSGYVEVRYDEESRRVVYEPVKLVQEYRTFDFVSPWEGMVYPRDDEKTEESD